MVAQLYAPHATLLPTLSNQPRNDHESIQDYFVTFLQRQPRGRIIQGSIEIDGILAVDTGIYEFIMATNGSVVRARYTFVYQLLENEWKILHHHSSLMPEKQ
jgi:hypothetical protein